MRYRSRLVVDLDILSSNLDKLKALAPSNEIMAMVKANAYGHGAVPIVRFACQNLGLKEFGLATLGEAIYLRDELPELDFEAYVFSDVQIALQECKEIYLNRRILPVLSNIEDLSFFLADKDFRHFPLILKFNTGMNRLGIKMDDLDHVANLLKKFGRKTIDHLMSHFACASQSMFKIKMNQKQLENFKQLKSELRARGIQVEKSSFSNSGAIEQKAGLEESHIRPGLMLYGPSSLTLPNRKGVWSGQMISRLETYIIQTFEVGPGEPIGYGATPCPRNGVVAIVALGYGDGIINRYRGAKIRHNGHVGEIYGRVNMDMAQVFFEQDAVCDLRAGDIMTIWDHDQESFLELAESIDTIPYEIFCQLTPRVPRVYRLE